MRFRGTVLERRSPDRIAALGLARTFQTRRIFRRMTVLDHVLIGLHRHQGLAIIVVEQNLDFIRRLSDRVLLIEKGAITREVAPEALGETKELGGYVAAE